LQRIHLSAADGAQRETAPRCDDRISGRGGAGNQNVEIAFGSRENLSPKT
jgi:hypothetical protein